MEVRLFYKTQRELAVTLNSLVDAYWIGEINEEALVKNVSEVYINNSLKVYKDGQFTTVLKQQCGKRRLDVVSRVLEMSRIRNTASINE